MERDIDSALDKCLTLLQRGQGPLDECLTHYPELAAELRPLLETAIAVRRVPPPVSSPAAFEAGKRRMLQALAERKHYREASPNLLLRVVRWMATLFGGRQRLAAPKYAPALPLALAAAMLLFLSIAGGLVLQSWLGDIVAQTATLTDVSGVVTVLPSGSKTWQPAAAGQVIAAGDRVRTGASSAVTLSFFDGSTSRLEARTELAVSQLSSQRDGDGKIIVLHQGMGRTHNHVQRLSDPASRFEIETPTAVATVRGTEFTVTVEADGSTSVAVTEGYVEVTAREITIAVYAGQRTTVQPEQPPAPVHPLPNATTLPAPKLTTHTPTPTPVPVPTRAPQPPGQTNTPQPPGQTNTPQPPGQPDTLQPPGQTNTPQPPGQTNTPQPPGWTDTLQPSSQIDTLQPPGQTDTPQPPGRTDTLQPSGQIDTPQPPGQTNTPQPPGQTKTPQPPGQTNTPQPPGQTNTPQPPGQTNTPQPPGQTNTPQPPGQTNTPQPPGQTKTPQPPGQTKTPKPTKTP